MGAPLELMRKIVEAWEGLDATSAPEAFADAPWMHPGGEPRRNRPGAA